jgi:hypothetical protein
VGGGAASLGEARRKKKAAEGRARLGSLDLLARQFRPGGGVLVFSFSFLVFCFPFLLWRCMIASHTSFLFLSVFFLVP